MKGGNRNGTFKDNSAMDWDQYCNTEPGVFRIHSDNNDISVSLIEGTKSSEKYSCSYFFFERRLNMLQLGYLLIVLFGIYTYNVGVSPDAMAISIAIIAAGFLGGSKS